MGGSSVSGDSSANNSTATTSGAQQLPRQWHIVMTRMQEAQTIFQDFTLDVEQSGDNLSGKGRDQIGDFTLTGGIASGNSISLQKQYDSAGYIWPIMFSGHVQSSPNGSFASGSYSWRKSDVERVQGEWQAALPSPQAPQQGMPTLPGGQGMQGMPPQGGMPPQAGPGQAAPTQGGFSTPGGAR